MQNELSGLLLLLLLLHEMQTKGKNMSQFIFKFTRIKTM